MPSRYGKSQSPRQLALEAIRRCGILLVFPIKNERCPPSLWDELYPKSSMRWDWGEGADPRVVGLWALRTELSESREVVYTKWFRGRATFFSRQFFTAMLRGLGPLASAPQLSRDAAALYERLLDDSPQTPRMLRADLGLEGKLYESAFNRAQRELWERLLIVGFGEVDEGSYPSLAVGATKLLFEDLWEAAAELDSATSEATLQKVFAEPEAAPFKKVYLQRFNPPKKQRSPSLKPPKGRV